jgi:undecaprenyl-diphosphatase
VGWVKGIVNTDQRGTDYRLGWAVIVGSVPIGIVGFSLRHVIETTLRSLWVVAAALILWSFVLWFADRFAERSSRAQRAHLRDESSITVVDALIIGATQCLALIPGVSRSGATISAGLLRGFDRTTATRWSFFLGIPALTLAGIFEAVTNFDEISTGFGWGPTLVTTGVSFVVAYATIAWLLKFVASNRFTVFIIYRIVLGLALIALLVFGVISAV